MCFAQIWVARYDGPGQGYDAATAIAVDEIGSVYVTGYSVGLVFTNDYATIKYDSLGNELWVARYDGPDNGDDIAFDMGLDHAGNLYVTGYSSDPVGVYDYASGDRFPVIDDRGKVLSDDALRIEVRP